MFYLMNKDTKLLSFKAIKLQENIYNFKIIESFSNLRPIGFNKIGSWVIGRKAPSSRRFIRDLLEKCGINNDVELIRFTHCVSINDTLWVKEENENISWKDVSLYSNDFDETISRFAFSGEGLHGLIPPSKTPELNINGQFAKCCKKYDDGIYILKRGSEGFKNAGKEPYCEYYASQVAKLICDEYVDYDLIDYHNKVTTKCKIFTNENIGYAPIHLILEKDATYLDILEYYDSIGSGELFRSMIVLDYLIMNEDRHMGNYGVLVDNDTFEILGLNPVFDFNISLLCFALDEDLEDLDNYINNLTTSFGYDFLSSAVLCMTPNIRKKLINMKGFKFKKNKYFNLSDERLELLNNLINRRIDILLNQSNDFKKSDKFV